jgi:hypothetical protein
MDTIATGKVLPDDSQSPNFFTINAAGEVTAEFEGTIKASKIIGSTILTSEEDPKVELSPTGLFAFNAAHEKVFAFTIATGELVLSGKITAGAGSTFPAAGITGLLTSAQIAEIAAAKIGGKLTAAQIESIAAAQITGLITSAQIEAIAAAKITGLISNAQIAEIEAAKISGTITETQIGNEAITTPKLKAEAVTAAKITALTITAGQIAALTITGAKIAAETITGGKIVAGTITAGLIAAEAIEAAAIKSEAVTSAKIAANTIVAADIAAETITGEKIAGATITGAKIVAGTILAEKLNVAELSAITANMGAITAGTITGATFRTASTDPKVQMDATGVFMTDAEAAKRVLLTTKGLQIREAPLGELTALSWRTAAGSIKEAIYGLEEAGPVHILLLESSGTSKNARLEVRGSDTAGTTATVRVVVNSEIKEIFNSEEKSHFLQLAAGLAKRKVAFGESEFEWSATEEKTSSNLKEITHGLGATPVMVMLTTGAGEASTVLVGARYIEGSLTETKFKCRGFAPVAVAKSTKVKFFWMAIG